MVYRVILTIVFVTGIDMAVGQICPEGNRRSAFRNGDYGTYLCDGDAGASSISVNEVGIQYWSNVNGARHTILKPPVTTIPLQLNLSAISRVGAEISIVENYESASVIYRLDVGDERPTFKHYFNLLIALVEGHATGFCPVDNKGQAYPELKSAVRTLEVLASAWSIRDCGVANTPDIYP